MRHLPSSEEEQGFVILDPKWLLPSPASDLQPCYPQGDAWEGKAILLLAWLHQEGKNTAKKQNKTKQKLGPLSLPCRPERDSDSTKVNFLKQMEKERPGKSKSLKTCSKLVATQGTGIPQGLLALMNGSLPLKDTRASGVWQSGGHKFPLTLL